MVDEFNKSLEKVINDNQWRDDPYFLSYHENDDKAKVYLIRGKWTVHEQLPRFWARQIVYIVDNKQGFKEWLWSVNDDRKPFFNTEGYKKARDSGAIRLPREKDHFVDLNKMVKAPPA